MSILRFRNGFKNSGKFWWMMKFHREALTPILLMKFLKSRLQRVVRIWVSAMFFLLSIKNEIARSVRGPKLQGPPCRKRNGEAVPRAANFGDLITADHTVLIDNCESRNNHRYAVVATHWIQAYPCKNKTSQETQRILKNFLEPDRKPKVIYTDNSLMVLRKEQCAE